MIYVIVGRRIRFLRERKNLTQAELAQATGFTRTSVTNMEAGVQRATLETLYEVARVLGVEITSLIPKLEQLDRAEKVIGIRKAHRLTNSRKRGKVLSKTRR